MRPARNDPHLTGHSKGPAPIQRELPLHLHSPALRQLGPVPHQHEPGLPTWDHGPASTATSRTTRQTLTARLPATTPPSVKWASLSAGPVPLRHRPAQPHLPILLLGSDLFLAGIDPFLTDTPSCNYALSVSGMTHVLACVKTRRLTLGTVAIDDLQSILRPERECRDALQPARTARDDAPSVRRTKSVGRTRSSWAWTCSAALADPRPRHVPVPHRHGVKPHRPQRVVTTP